jgi:hypothetical protein
MRRARTIVGIVLVVGGAVWILQGLDIAFAPESFMTDNRRWVLYGALSVAAGFGLITWSRK